MTLKIQINNEVRDMTSEEENQHNADLQQTITEKEKIIAKENNKTSGKQKLKDLGLDDDEIKALTGV
jgi:hypothetical protein|tara:strand:- start:73 stop:273 length:201 start_codon:yes stop_codon:yes gene_type:complete